MLSWLIADVQVLQVYVQQAMSTTSIVCLAILLLLAPWPSPVPQATHQTISHGLNESDHGSRCIPAVWTTTGHHGSRRLASAQGLRVSDENLGASERSGLDLFSQFEDLLELSDDFTGGRRTGSKNTGSRRGRARAVYSDSMTLRQQQLKLYHVAGTRSNLHDPCARALVFCQLSS